MSGEPGNHVSSHNEEFREYLEASGVMEVMTKVLVLYYGALETFSFRAGFFSWFKESSA